MWSTPSWNSPVSKEAAEANPLPKATRIWGGRQWVGTHAVVIPRWVCLCPCKPDLLITLCHHLMTACPTFQRAEQPPAGSQGSRLSPNPWTASTCTKRARIRDMITGGHKSEMQTPQEASLLPLQEGDSSRCKCNPLLGSWAGRGWGVAETSRNWPGRSSPATAQPR